MRELTDKDFALVNETVMPIVERYALEDTEPGLYNPFLFVLTIPVKNGEYRDFTEYNIKRTIGLKTVRFNRGYGSKGKPPKQMQWEVKGVVLMDGEENECDPYNVPEDFWPVTIALKLGTRIG